MIGPKERDEPIVPRAALLMFLSKPLAELRLLAAVTIRSQVLIQRRRGVSVRAGKVTGWLYPITHFLDDAGFLSARLVILLASILCFSTD